MDGKVVSVTASSLSILLLKLAVQDTRYNIAELFEMLFYIWGTYALLTMLYMSFKRQISLFDFKVEAPWKLAQLMSLYTIVDAFCILYMSLATYCAIKLCLTATFKVIRDPITCEWKYTTEGVPHRLRRILISSFLLPLVVVYDICYQVLYRDRVQRYFSPDSTTEMEKEELDMGPWIGLYSLFIFLHVINTALLYQRHIGTRIKTMTYEHKFNDLLRIRWLSAAIICVMTPVIALLLHRTQTGESMKVFENSYWLVWVAATAYVLLLVIFYNVSLNTSSRKDALIPTKRHSIFLLVTVPPMVICHQLFLSNDALRGYTETSN